MCIANMVPQDLIQVNAAAFSRTIVVNRALTKFQHTRVLLDRTETDAILVEPPDHIPPCGGETLYRDIVETCADAVVIVSFDQTIALVNQAAETMFGYERAEIVGQPLDILIPDAVRASHRALVEEFEQSGDHSRFMGERQVSIEGLRADGTQFPLNVSILRSGKGKDSALVAIVRDITEQTRLVSTDPLTGALNRRTFTTRGEAELKRARRHGRPIAVAMVDIDHFKKINDSYGHRVGDRAICHAVNVLSDTLRESDILGRWGGEEFAVILTDIEEESAVIVAQRLRKAINGAVFTDATAGTDPIGLTVSIGVAESGKAEDDLAYLIDQADQALYIAKRTGRDKVCSIDQSIDNGDAHDAA
jgi:diguanylate cyclase (GGDEF)-like protein/PAS domain S-box-containing protein